MKVFLPSNLSGLRWESRRTAQVTLSFILLVSGVVIEIAIAGAFFSYLLSSSGKSDNLSLKALSLARAGIQDAELVIARNKEIGNAFSYSIPANGGSASVEIFQERSNESYIYTIVSQGNAGGKKRKLRSVVVVNANNGLIESQKIQEVSLEP